MSIILRKKSLVYVRAPGGAILQHNSPLCYPSLRKPTLCDICHYPYNTESCQGVIICYRSTLTVIFGKFVWKFVRIYGYFVRKGLPGISWYDCQNTVSFSTGRNSVMQGTLDSCAFDTKHEDPFWQQYHYHLFYNTIRGDIFCPW